MPCESEQMPEGAARTGRARLVDAAGKIEYGCYASAVEDVNYRDYRFTTPFGRELRGLRKRLAFNQFQFLGAVGPELLFGCAIADIGYLSTAFVYFYRPSDRAFHSYGLKQPIGIGTQLSQTPESGCFEFKKGANRVVIDATPDTRTLDVSLASGVRLNAVFDEAAPRVEPLRICTRAGRDGWVYVRKTAATRVTGAASCPLGELDLGALDLLGHNDWSAGFMRRETFWNWACFALRLPDGRTLGLNLSCGVNETSYSENCYWLDGKLHHAQLAAFEYDHFDVLRPWRIHTRDGAIRLEFTPDGQYAEKVNAFVVASNFHQLYGRFSGTIRLESGATLTVQDAYGYAEEHYAKW